MAETRNGVHARQESRNRTQTRDARTRSDQKVASAQTDGGEPLDRPALSKHQVLERSTTIAS